jgi:glycosyltransferase involved in cell wall biosynthesis
VGRLERRKGVDVALAALARVPGARLDIVGDGAERARLVRRARSLALAERVRFHGWLDDPRPVVTAADAALCSSRDEALSIALVEAMALGRPVVALPVGGVVELVRDGAGWLAAARTGDALAERMRAAVADRAACAVAGARARALVERELSVERMCERYGEIYRSIL